MDKITIHGGKTLNGSVRVEGAKNAVLPILAAALLASESKQIIQDQKETLDYYMKEIDKLKGENK